LRGFNPTIAKDGRNGGIISTVKEVQIENRLVFKTTALNPTNLNVIVPKTINNVGFHRIDPRHCVLQANYMFHHPFP
jgi:hypothetical protein